MKKILLTAIAYAALLSSVNKLMDIGLLEVRLGAFLPPLAGMTWGLQGALGVALGNVARDIYVGDDPAAIPIGALANFIYAYAPYKIWLLTNGDKENYFSANSKSLLKYFLILLVSASLGTVVLIEGVKAVGYELPDYFMYQVFVSNFDFPFLLTPPLLIILSGRGWLFPREGGMIKKAPESGEVLRPLSLMVALTLLLGGTVFIILVSAFFVLKAILTGNFDIIKIFQELYSYHYLTLHLFFLVLMGILLIVERRLVRPLTEISAGIKDFAMQRGELKAVELPEIHTGDELELLRNSFAKMMQEIINYMRQLKSVTAEKERITTELNVAKEIQSGMLPHDFDFGRNDFEIFATMNPARQVGGDFYDFYQLDENHLAITVADVSGKGIPASLFMVISKTVLKNFATVAATPDDYAAVLSCANNQLCQGNEEMMFVTVFFGVLEIDSGKFTYVNGGHNPPVIYRRAENRCEFLSVKKNFVLGAMEDMPFQQQEIILEHGDLIFVYTDGVNEAMNENHEEYTSERLLNFMNGTNCDAALNVLLAAVKKDLAVHVGNAEQSDDITMMALRRN